MSPSAGYSGTPLPRKLGIKPEQRVLLVNAPDGFERVLGELPAGVELRRRAQGRFDVIVAFCAQSGPLQRGLPRWREALHPSGGLWIVWPKRASRVPTDVAESLVRERGLAAGLVDNKVCAIDDTWSGLRFVYRLRDRPST